MKKEGMESRSLHRGLLTLVCLWAVPAAMAAEPAAQNECTADSAKTYRTERQDALSKEKEQLQKALSEASAGNFEAAVKLCTEVEAACKAQPGTDARKVLEDAQEIEQKIRRAWATDLLQKANEKYLAKDYDKAIQIAGSIQDPDSRTADFLKVCQAARDGANFRNATNNAPEVTAVKTARKEVANLMREAKVFYANKRYESAATSLERLLIVDPFNSEAIELLNLCYSKLFQIGNRRYEANREGILAANLWEWTEPISGIDNSTMESAAQVKAYVHNDLYNQMERIVFPTIDFQQTDLATVIRYLGQKSRTVDPEKKGVDVILTSTQDYGRRMIDLKMNNVSMLEVLRLICQQANVAYSLQGNVVVIGARSKMANRTFELRQEVVNKLCPNASAAGGASPQQPTMDAYTVRSDGGAGGGMGGGMSVSPDGGMGGSSMGLSMGEAAKGLSEVTASTSTAAAAAATAQAARNKALTDFFIALGVAFPGDATLQYDYSSGRLMVMNTMENLQLLGKVIAQLNERETYLVLIESKLVELNNTTLDELGFDWQFSASPTDSDGWSMSTGSNVIRTGKTEGTDTTYYRVVNGLKIFPNFGEKIFGSDMNVNLSLSINAVSQNSNTETLSSPRILSNDGTTAMIEMVEETYFVEDWEAPETDSDINIGLIGPEPDWGDMHPLGITFSVTPHISSNKQSITLKDLDVKFSVHTDDTHHAWTMSSWYYDGGGTRHNTFSTTYDLKMPIITARRMKATLTVDDGATVMLGGLVKNTNKARDDKWPFLGDIPFLGNFFRDQQSEVENQTMVIFVTARIIHPDGMPKRSIQNQGLIDFKR